MNPSPVESFQIEPLPTVQDASAAPDTFRGKFQRAVSRLNSCIPGSGAKRGFAPFDAARKHAIIRQLNREDRQMANALRHLTTPMTVNQMGDFVAAFQQAGPHKKYAMQRAVDTGGEALQFLIENLNDVWSVISERSSAVAVSFFSTNGPLQATVKQVAGEVFGQLNVWTISSLRGVAPFVKDVITARKIVDLLLDKPWSRSMLDTLVDGTEDHEAALRAFVTVFELGGNFEAEMQNAFSGRNAIQSAEFLLYGLGREGLSSQQQVRLAEVFNSMNVSAKAQTVEALRTHSSLSELVRAFPTHWGDLSDLNRAIYLNLFNVANSTNQPALGEVAEDSEGILTQRPVVHEIINRTQLARLKSKDSGGPEFLNQVFDEYYGQLDQKLDNQIAQLKRRGLSAQVPELAQSFLPSQHFTSDVPLFGLTLREAVAGVVVLGEAEFDHLPWGKEFENAAVRKPAIEKELIQQLADSRIGNGSEPSCYEGSIEHVVLSLRPFLDLAPPLPTKGEFFTMLPQVFNRVLDALEQEPATLDAIKTKLQITKGQSDSFDVAGYYAELEPQIHFMMAREFPALINPERKAEANALYREARSYVDELNVSDRPALHLLAAK